MLDLISLPALYVLDRLALAVPLVVLALAALLLSLLGLFAPASGKAYAVEQVGQLTRFTGDLGALVRRGR